MPDTTVRVEYIGAVQNFSEVTITGNQQVWRIGSSAFVETGRASQLVASGNFRYLANDPAMLPANQAKVGAIHSSGGVGIPPVRWGFVTARTGWNPYWHTTNKQCNSRSFDYARDNLTSIKLGFQNAYVAVTAVGAEDGKEYGFGVATIRAQIEYPVGSGYTDVTFGGQLVGTIPSCGLIESDEIAVNIPRSAKFYYRIMYRNIDGAGMVYTRNGVTGDDVAQFATSGLGDIMNGAGTITQTQAGSYYGPTYVVQKTRIRSLATLGDSRQQGLSDTPESVGFNGQLARALSPNFGVCKLGQYSDRLSWFLPYGTLRQSILRYATAVWTNHGINDIYAGSISAATHASNVTALARLCGSREFIAMTLAPKTTSTDSWATTDNQTLSPSTGVENTQRVSYNNLLRSGWVSGVSGYFEAADPVESARDSGLWKVNGAAFGYTADGTHETAAGNALVSAAVPMWLAVKDVVI